MVSAGCLYEEKEELEVESAGKVLGCEMQVLGLGWLVAVLLNLGVCSILWGHRIGDRYNISYKRVAIPKGRPQHQRVRSTRESAAPESPQHQSVRGVSALILCCLLYTSDAADE